VNLAWISLLALAITVLASCTTSLNPGVIAVVLAWVIGTYLHAPGGEAIGLKGVVAGFPSELFLTLVGVTLLFSAAQANGTLERVTRVTVRGCRGNAGMIPVAFFGLALVLASIGAGNIAAAALVGPMAMAVAAQARIPAFLMTIMVAHGAVAGALSPFAPTGIIAAELMDKMGLSGHGNRFYLANLLANVAVAFAGYGVFGGLALLRREAAAEEDSPGPSAALEARHVLTLVVIAALIAVVILLGVQVGMGAFAGAALLILAGAAEEKSTVRAMPWTVILMVCGVTVLTALLEKTGGLDLFTTILTRFSTRRSVAGVIAFVTGLVSVYSSTSGVVLPAFLPSVPGLVQKLGGGDPVAIASSILVGGHLVDVSPLSTIGALCVAGASAEEDRRGLFNRVLAWGLSMSVVGAVICQLAFGGSS
jgi:di/tricarboxylate transporter